MDKIKFIVYSDIHYDRLGARCITIDDCENIEKIIHKRVEEGGFDFSIFCGDRFLKREPEDEVKTRADISLFNNILNSVNNKKHFSLIGNHDWVDHSRKWNTSKLVSDLSTDELIVLDDSYTYIYPMEPHFGVRIHSLPSGFKMDMNNYNICPNDLNIFIFHDMVIGCKLDDKGRVMSESGISLNEIDRPEFDVVFGGDVHIPQRLSFKNTEGGYVGSVLQRTFADADCERGWMEVVAIRNSNKWEFDIDFVPVRGFFTKFSVEVNENTTFESIRLDEERIYDKCCEVELIGSKINVDRIADDLRWKNYEEYLNVRNLIVVRKYIVKQKESVVDMSRSNNVLEDLSIYLESGFVDIGDLSKKEITNIVRSVVEDK